MATATDAPLIPEGYSPPATIITATDRSGWVMVATALGLTVVLLFLAIRVYIRLQISPPFRYDDAALVATSVR
jgi:hypothetical protein